MTRTLAIETSGSCGSLALQEDGQPVPGGEVLWLPSDRRTAQSLAPAIGEVLGRAGWTSQSIEMVAIAVGPGSFTGLRIGVTTAKTFAYAIGADLVGVTTMEVLAEPVPRADRLWTVIDAQREELFVATFARIAVKHWQMSEPIRVVGRDAWLNELRFGDVVTGPVLSRFVDRLPSQVTVADQSLWTPSAECVARVAWRAYQQGRRDDVFQLVPQYHRLSAAEEKLRRI